MDAAHINERSALANQIIPDSAKNLTANGSPFATAPEQPTAQSDIIAALRDIPEIDGLRDEEYAWIASNGTERVGPDRSVVFVENEPSHHLHLVLRGEIHVQRRNSGPVSLYMGRAGRVTGKLPYSRMKTWGGDGWTSGDFWVLDIHEALFPEMLQAIPSMAQRCVSILLDHASDSTRADE